MKEEYCPIHEVTKLIGGKWKMPLMYVIQSGPKRFGELRRTLSPITEQMLTKQLRQIENHNLHFDCKTNHCGYYFNFKGDSQSKSMFE